jgi:hypothetical protein
LKYFNLVYQEIAEDRCAAVTSVFGTERPFENKRPSQKILRTCGVLNLSFLMIFGFANE